MPSIVTFRIEGGDEIARALESKPPAIARQMIATSLRDAAAIWQREMITLVHRGWHVFSSSVEAAGLKVRGGHGLGGREREFGVIAANIQVQAKPEGDYAGVATVGPGGKAFWARFLEFGTASSARSGKKRAHHATRAYPFIRPAFESQKDAVLEKFTDDLREQLRAELGMK